MNITTFPIYNPQIFKISCAHMAMLYYLLVTRQRLNPLLHKKFQKSPDKPLQWKKIAMSWHCRPTQNKGGSWWQKSNILFLSLKFWINILGLDWLVEEESNSNSIVKWTSKFFTIFQAWYCYKLSLMSPHAWAISLLFEFLWSFRQWWEWFAGINVCLALNQSKWFLSLCLLQ